MRLVVDRLVHALSRDGEGGYYGLRGIYEVLELLEREKILEIGRREKFVKFFLGFASCS